MINEYEAKLWRTCIGNGTPCSVEGKFILRGQGKRNQFEHWKLPVI